jgi:aconitate hydratase 2/2-methylisocitrate dehydratase
MAFDFEMIKKSAFNIEKNSIMNIYNDYLQEIEERKGQGLNPKPIDGAELLSAILHKDSDNADRDEFLKFSFTMLFQELLQQQR